MKYAPIALFTFNRIDHIKKTVETLLNNKGISESDLYIFSDEGKNEKEKAVVQKVRAYIDAIQGFNKIHKVYHAENKGLAQSIIHGVSDILKSHDRVIVLEDDLQTTPWFLTFMNEALAFYLPDQVWSVAAYSPNIEIPKSYPFETYMVHRNCSWGWATWKQNWEKVDWEVKDFNEFYTSKLKRKQFERGGNDLSVMLLKQQQQMIHSWSIRFNYAAYKNKLPTVYPIKSLVKNLGTDGSGTNMKKSNKYQSDLQLDKIDKAYFCGGDFFNTTIENRFCKFYNTSVYRRIINFFKTQQAVCKLNKVLSDRSGSL
jgi:hypothetical protein